MKIKYLGKGVKGLTKDVIYRVDKSLRYKSVYYVNTECSFKIIEEKDLKYFKVIS